MEEVIKQSFPGLIKTSPYLFGGGIILYLIAKMAFKFFKERDEKRELLFKETLTSREKFFVEELDKKDAIIHEKDDEIKSLHQQVVTLIKEDIKVRENNNVLMDNLRKLLEVALNVRA